MLNMVKPALPYIAEICGEVLKTYAINAVRAQALRPHPIVTISKGEGDSPPRGTGCPYCAVSKHLAAVYRYLRRGSEKGSLAPLYQRLAQDQVAEALTALRDVPAQMSHMRLERALNALELALSRPIVSAVEQGMLARDAWAASELSLDLAEYANGVAPALPVGDVIEGEVREVADAGH
jgi:hypothetical protein